MVENAKQFMPFDSLKGFREVLKVKEKVKEEKVVLTDSSLSELEFKFKNFDLGSKVNIIHFKNNRYILTTGIITNIDYIKRNIIIDNKNIINTSNIKEILSWILHNYMI